MTSGGLFLAVFLACAVEAVGALTMMSPGRTIGPASTVGM